MAKSQDALKNSLHRKDGVNDEKTSLWIFLWHCAHDFQLGCRGAKSASAATR
jgi:hypothetical protein